jgi:hypothetical protein
MTSSLNARLGSCVSGSERRRSMRPPHLCAAPLAFRSSMQRGAPTRARPAARFAISRPSACLSAHLAGWRGPSTRRPGREAPAAGNGPTRLSLCGPSQGQARRRWLQRSRGADVGAARPGCCMTTQSLARRCRSPCLRRPAMRRSRRRRRRHRGRSGRRPWRSPARAYSGPSPLPPRQSQSLAFGFRHPP